MDDHTPHATMPGKAGGALPVMTAPARANPHYERLGGADVVARLAEAFYRAMDELPEATTIRAMHDVNARIFGAVLNDLDLEDQRYGQYYQYYRYGYYTGSHEAKPTRATS